MKALAPILKGVTFMTKRIIIAFAAVVVVIAAICALFLFRNHSVPEQPSEGSVEQSAFEPQTSPDYPEQTEDETITESTEPEQEPIQLPQEEANIDYSEFFENNQTSDDKTSSDEETDSLKDVEIREDTGDWGPIQW